MKYYFLLVGFIGLSLLLFLSRPIHYNHLEKVSFDNENAQSYMLNMDLNPFDFLPFQIDYIYEHQLDFLIQSHIEPYYPPTVLPTFFMRDWSIEQYIDRTKMPTTQIKGFLFVDASSVYHLMIVYEKKMTKDQTDLLSITYQNNPYTGYKETLIKHQLTLIHQSEMRVLNIGYQMVFDIGDHIELPSFYIKRYFHNPDLKGGLHMSYHSDFPSSDYFSLDIFLYQRTTISNIHSEHIGLNQFKVNPHNQPIFYPSRHHILYVKEH